MTQPRRIAVSSRALTLHTPVRVDDGVYLLRRRSELNRSLSKSELREFKTMLLERTQLLKGDLAGMEYETRGKGSSNASDQSSAPGHTAELASDESEKDLTYGRMGSQTEELKEIHEAFERIKDGSFGQCEKCEGIIPKERLRAIPYARMCVKCQAKEEQE